MSNVVNVKFVFLFSFQIGQKSIFKYIKDNILKQVLGGTTPDLTEDGLEMAKQVFKV